MARPAATLLMLLLLAGCRNGLSRRPPIHLNPNMDRQQKYRPEGESHFFRNGSTMQPPVAGTVARGDLREDEELFSGRSAFGAYARNPILVTDDVLRRGRERFSIHCRPCHGERGDGKGVLFLRGGVRSRDLRDDAVRAAADGRLFEVISRGSGLMPGYRGEITPKDRWAIIAYVRQIQGRAMRGAP